MPYYTRNGYQLFYHLAGEGNKGQPVVFIHGYLGSSESHWGLQLNDSQLNSQYQLIGPDLRGYGKSSVGKKVEKHKTHDHILDLRYLLSQLDFQDKPVFVGYSIGGTLALQYAIEYPDSVQGIVLVSPRPFLGKITRSWNFLSKDKRSGKNKSIAISFLWKIVKRIQKIKTYFSIKRQYRQSEQYLRQLEKINVPILILHGTKDTVNPIISFDVLKKHLPQAEVIVLEGDHGITHERHKEFNSILTQFLDKTTDG